MQTVQYYLGKVFSFVFVCRVVLKVLQEKENGSTNNLLDALAPFVNLSIAEKNKEILGKSPVFIPSLFGVLADTVRKEEFMPRAKLDAAKVSFFTRQTLY